MPTPWGLNTPFDPAGVDTVWNGTGDCHPRLFITCNPFRIGRRHIGIGRRRDACATIFWFVVGYALRANPPYNGLGGDDIRGAKNRSLSPWVRGRVREST